MRVRFSYISRLIEEFGLDRVREPHVKHLQGPLWEMCMKGKDGISRAIYVTATGQRQACISHHPTVEAHDTTARTSLRLLAVLNVRFKYACARQAARASS